MFNIIYNSPHHLFIVMCVSIFITQIRTECVIQTGNPCKCVDPQYGTIDLSTIPNLPFTKALGDGYTYSYHPCKGTNCGSPMTNTGDVASCQSLYYLYYKNGYLNKATFSAVDSKTVTVTYIGDNNECPNGQTRKTVVTLKCDKTIPREQFEVSNPVECNFAYQVTGPHVCFVPNSGGGGGGGGGISVGDVLLIIFFIGFFLYFLIGALFLYFIKKVAIGTDLIIHKSFWFALPFLAKDGIMFIAYKTCCKNRANNYDSI